MFLRLPECPFCSHANPFGAKFCNECGSPLSLKPCRQCEAVNDQFAKNCYRCGVEFQSVSLEAKAAPRASITVETAGAPAPLTDFDPAAQGAVLPEPGLPDPGSDYVMTPPRSADDGTISEFPITGRATGSIPLADRWRDAGWHSLPSRLRTAVIPALLVGVVAIAAYYGDRQQEERGGTNVSPRPNTAPGAVATAPVDQSVQQVIASDVESQKPAVGQSDAEPAPDRSGADSPDAKPTQNRPDSALTPQAIGPDAAGAKPMRSRQDDRPAAQAINTEGVEGQGLTTSQSQTGDSSATAPAQPASGSANQGAAAKKPAGGPAEPAPTATAATTPAPANARHKAIRTPTRWVASARSEANPAASKYAAATAPLLLPLRDQRTKAPQDAARASSCTQAKVTLGLCTLTTRTEAR